MARAGKEYSLIENSFQFQNPCQNHLRQRVGQNAGSLAKDSCSSKLPSGLSGPSQEAWGSNTIRVRVS